MANLSVPMVTENLMVGDLPVPTTMRQIPSVQASEMGKIPSAMRSSENLPVPTEKENLSAPTDLAYILGMDVMCQNGPISKCMAMPSHDSACDEIVAEHTVENVVSKKKQLQQQQQLEQGVPVSLTQQQNHEQTYPLPCSTHQEVVRDKSLFLTTLYNFLTAFGVELVIPKLGGNDLNLHEMYCEVTVRGGIEQVIRNAQWKEIIDAMNINVHVTNASFVIRKHYMNLLFHYEHVYYHRNEGRIRLPLEPLSAPNIAMGPATDGTSCIKDQPKIMSESKPKKQRLDSLQVFGVDPASSVGASATGIINGRVEEGYLITVVVDGQKLSGILYHVLAEKVKHYASVTSLLNGVGRDLDPVGTEVQLYKNRKQHACKSNHANGPPRRTKTGYNIFLKEQRARLLELNSESKGLGKKVIEMWNKLPEDEKALYVERGFHEREKLKREFLELQERGRTNCDKIEGPGSMISTENGIYDASYDYHVSLLDVSGDNIEHGSTGIHLPSCYDALVSHDHKIQYEMQRKDHDDDDDDDEKAYHVGPKSQGIKTGEEDGLYCGHSRVQEMMKYRLLQGEVTTQDTMVVSSKEGTTHISSHFPHYITYSSSQPLITNSTASSMQQASYHQPPSSQVYSQEIPCTSSQKHAVIQDNFVVNSHATNRVAIGGEPPYMRMVDQPINPYTTSLSYRNQSMSQNPTSTTRPMGVRPQETYHQNAFYYNNMHNVDVAYRPTPHPIHLHQYPNQNIGNEIHPNDYELGITSQECPQQTTL